MLLRDVIKRFLVALVGIIISSYIWHLNRNIFGNTIDTCLILSSFVFLITYIPFEAYFSVRKIWYDRWTVLKVKNLIKEKIKIPIREKGSNKKLVANLIRKSNSLKEKQIKTIILVDHGYSDTKETLEYLYLPLAMQGYVILAYDARGTGESKKIGKRNQVKKRIEDHKKVIQWIKNNEKYHDYNIFSIGFSIGAIISLSGSFIDHSVKKIIAISCISRYKRNVWRLNPLILLSYILRGISLFPDEELNEKLSPYLIFKKQKEKVSPEIFKILSKRVYLVHSKNDRVIKFRNFKENLSILDLPQENKIIFKKGGHTMKKNEVALVGGIMQFLES